MGTETRTLIQRETVAFRYRPEIDGLRALAVVPVILFHAGLQAFSGGYVGVDVFFVISGYLITSILLKDLSDGSYSIGAFYERRARRILPSLAAVVVVTLALAWVVMLPDELKRFGDSVFSVATFTSNFFFWLKTDYFAPSAEAQPLLHTWSLAVEEQYYILFPLLLAFIYRRQGKNRIMRALLALMAASLAFCLLMSRISPLANFYLLPTRGWELMVGSVLAVMPELSTYKFASGKLVRQIVPAIGVAAILLAVFTFDKRTPFPSLYTAIPVLGTACVIASPGRGSAANRLLAMRPVVFVGLISYSAYLWHQPLFAFARLYETEGSITPVLCTLIVVTMVLAFLTWKYIELPFRKKGGGGLAARRSCLYAGGLMLVCLAIVGAVIHAFNGFEGLDRWKNMEEALAVKNQVYDSLQICKSKSIASSLGPLVCKIGDIDAKAVGVLWGDSMAGALVHGLDVELKRRGQSYLAVISGGCQPIEGLTWPSRLDLGCTADRHVKFVEDVSRDPELSTVIWMGWMAGLAGEETSDDVTEKLLDGRALTKAALGRSILRTAAKLRAAGKQVVFVIDTPEFPFPAPDYAIRKLRHQAQIDDRVMQSVSVQAMLERQAALRVITLELGKTVQVFDGLQALCESEVCRTHDERYNLLYSDSHHYSLFGSQRLAERLLRVIE